MAKMNKRAGPEGQGQQSGVAAAAEDGSGLELPELFCSLGSLIVEGRLPAGPGEGKGYYEGPHVELPGKIFRHKCSQTEYLCNKNENFRKHMLLLWQNNVPMSIEILLCSDCRVGQAKARSLEVTTVPEPGSILLEQWTVSMETTGGARSGHTMTGLSLLQAVRSYLHFSQLSAWYNKTGGSRPWNVLIRITIPGEEFSSKFSQAPEEHYFPPAGGVTSISVSVRSLPRSDDIPRVICDHSAVSQLSSTSPEDTEETKLGIAGALAWRQDQEQDLRKTLARSKLVTSADLGDCPGRLTKSDSMDSMLGDSLLDPPQSLSKMAPKRYQSPSRCGSPSLEAPEPLMGYRNPPPSYDQAVSQRQEYDGPDARLNRHDLLRRRDLTLFHGGLHPRLFQVQPRLSLPPKPVQAGVGRPASSTVPCRAVVQDPPSSSSSVSHVVTDTMPIRCTISGKHICQYEEEVEEHQHKHDASPSPGPSGTQQHSPSGEHYRQEELGAKAKGWSSRVVRTSTPYSRDSSSDSSSMSDHHKKRLSYRPHRDADCVYDQSLQDDSLADLKHDEMDDVLQYLKSRHSPSSSISKERQDLLKEDPLLGCKSSRRPSFEEIFDRQHLKPQAPVTQVYRSEISNNNSIPAEIHKPDLLDPVLQPKSSDSFSSSVQPQIHSLRETLQYCSQDDSSNDVSPLSPVLKNFDDDIKTFTEEHNNNSNNNVVDVVDKLGCDSTKLPDNSLGDLCLDLERKCLITKKNICPDQENISPTSGPRVRSYSEASKLETRAPRPTLQPLDFSFEGFNEDWSVSEENLEEVCNKRRISIEEDDGVPSANKKNAFRKSFDSAASMVFQRRTGLPLTSSPAPLRRGGIKFDFDSGLATPKDIKRALFEPQSPTESECGSPKKKKRDPRKLLSTSAPATVSNNNLLCNFEESVLNGRLEPVSTVEGFTAEIGASGSFQPAHLSFPVTVFFYTLCENSNYASPYLGHINLGKKGYRIPDKGTIQLTLFNPLGTVVKMFVVMYDLTDMPPNSQTFLRQRTLYMPSDSSDNDPDAQKWLRYLIHLRVASSKSGKIYLHTDVRMIIFRKSDLDTATDHESGKGWELRSFTRGPTNPKFSPRK